MSESTEIKFKDVIVWNAAAFSTGHMEAAGQLAAKSGRPVIVIGPDESIETLDKGEMRRAGWVPLADLAALREAAQVVVADLSTEIRECAAEGHPLCATCLNILLPARDALRAVLASADSEEATDA